MNEETTEKNKLKEETQSEKENMKEEKSEKNKETEKEKSEKKKEKIVREVAIANGYSLRISPKHSFAVCKIIKGKSPEKAILRLEEVLDDKRAVPMAGREVGHQKGKGIAGARFPKNACKEIIGIIKQGGANAIVAGIENPIITLAKADRAAAPYRRAGRKAKRTHIHLEIRDKTKLAEKKK